MTVYNELKVGGDLLIHVESLEYCTVGATVKNVKQASSGDDGNTIEVTDPVGIPLKLNSGVWELMEAADIADVTGVIVSGPAIEVLEPDDVSANKYLILKNAPAILNQSKLAAKDPYDDNINATNYRNALKALKFELRSEPSKSTTQTE